MFKILSSEWKRVDGKQYFYFYDFILENLCSMSKMKNKIGRSITLTEGSMILKPAIFNHPSYIPSSIKNMSYSKAFV